MLLFALALAVAPTPYNTAFAQGDRAPHSRRRPSRQRRQGACRQ
ncbi:MAG: hypothetical protein WDN06_19600 [Asticcacaulis sp.]